MISRSVHKCLAEMTAESPISAVDLFCGAGGLTHGLMRAGIKVEAGIDIDGQMEYAYMTNNPGVRFLQLNVARMNCRSIGELFRSRKLRLLAGCAPCKPFSKLTNGVKQHEDWDLLDNFGRFVKGILPELVTMENVPELADRGRAVFDRFIGTLEQCGYLVDAQIVHCPEYGVPQARRRLVVLASRLGKIAVPKGRYRNPDRWKTVRHTIAKLRKLKSGEQDPRDRLHFAPLLSETNLRRIRATPQDGGTRHSWPDDLVLECHKKKSGQRYHSIYGRMWWDKPAPTMTTLCTGIGNGRFGHPDQNRSITLREAAMFQSFPRSYEFWPPEEKLNRSAISRMIGNAVPPKLAKALGDALISHVSNQAVQEGAGA